MKNKKKSIVLATIVTIFLLGIIGITYAAYTFTRIGNNQQLVLGDIYMHYNETNQLSLSNAMPSTTYDTTKYFEFRVDGKNTYTKENIYYEILLNHGDEHETRTERIKDSALKFTLVEIKDNIETVVVDGKSYNQINNTRIWVNTIPANTTTEVNITYRLYMWIDNSVVIGNTANADYDMDTWNNEVYASIKVNVTGDFEEKKLGEPLVDTFRQVLTSRTGLYTEEDGIMYVSGPADDGDSETTTDVDFNYVWYSGKLWRITAINADGTMKMITQDNITTIEYGTDYNFYTDESTSSWIYQWLNEDFLNTLYNYENIIVTDYKWNATAGDGTITTKLAETTLVPASVGLLNSYEYYKSYENLGSYANGYLRTINYWWLLNRYNTSYSDVWVVGGPVPATHNGSTSTNRVRPSVNLKSTIQIVGGTGTFSNPYRIKGDISDVIANTTLLNTRQSGEYVNFDNELYRIVSVESDGSIKINKVDYIRDENDAVMAKVFSSDITYGLGMTIACWDYYLNNTWYNSISQNYRNMLVEGTYYLGQVGGAISYKAAICSAASNTETTKECTKTSSVWTGYVGLPRYGEMYTVDTESVWLITPYDSSSMHTTTDYYGATTSTHLSRPSIHLSSDVIITGGTGLETAPYEIYLDSEGEGTDTEVPSEIVQTYNFASYYIGEPKLGYVSNKTINSSSIAISSVLPDDVVYINVVDVYSLHQQKYISGGKLSRLSSDMKSNYMYLMGVDFCSNNPTVCTTYSKEEFNYLADSWKYSSGDDISGTITTEDNITFSYNSSDKKIYVANGNAYYTFYLAIQFVVPGYQPSEWEHFTNIAPCLHSNTIVYVYDRKKKRFKKKKIKDVDYDDLLLVWDFDRGEFAVSKPVWVKKKETINSYNLLTFSDGSTLRTINQHRIFNKEKGMFTLCMTDDTPIGTTTFNSKGEYVTLVSKEVIYKEVDYYNVWTDYHINLFTDNILTSCRFSNLYKIEDMKYVYEERDNSDYISKLNIKDKWIKGLRLNEQPIDINRDKSLKFTNIKEYIELLESLDIDNIDKI